MADRCSFGDDASNRKESRWGTNPFAVAQGAHDRGRDPFVRPRNHASNLGAKTTVAVILPMIGVALVGAALIAAFAIHPPTLGWVGFAIVSIIVLGLGALTPIAFERTRQPTATNAFGRRTATASRGCRLPLQRKNSLRPSRRAPSRRRGRSPRRPRARLPSSFRDR
jgi:hypothetical protein